MCEVCGQCSRRRDTSRASRSEEHTSELQSQSNLVCRLLLEKKKYIAFSSPTPGAPARRAAPSPTEAPRCLTVSCDYYSPRVLLARHSTLSHTPRDRLLNDPS